MKLLIDERTYEYDKLVSAADWEINSTYEDAHAEYLTMGFERKYLNRSGNMAIYERDTDFGYQETTVLIDNKKEVQ